MNDLYRAGNKRRKLFLAIVSGILLGLAFPPIPVGVTVFVAFIPFFLLLESLETYGESFRYGYLLLIIWHSIVGYWSGGFTHMRDAYQMIGGTGLLVINPFFYLIPVVVFLYVRRRYSINVAMLTFPFVWISIELFRAHTDLALPWITLGNTQTNDLPAIQIASVTGVYGISFWILIVNIVLVILFRKILNGEWKLFDSKSIGLFASAVILYLIPIIYGTIVLNGGESPSQRPKITIAMIQPNIDPFEKWEKDPMIPFQLHSDMTRELRGKEIDLVIWSETSIPFYITHPTYRYYLDLLKTQVDAQQINLLTGVPDIVYYKNPALAPKTSKQERDGTRYDNYNSSMLIRHNSDSLLMYHKMLLVPFAERVPFSNELNFLNTMQWNFGIGGWGVGSEQTVYRFTTRRGGEASFSNMICFESIFPGFVTGFVRNGAQFLTIITMDSWWGNTSGLYQHKQYAVLRAVENRRWIARCATGGVSCIIDPFGHILQSTKYATKQTLIGELELRNDLTFYARYGDWFAEFCVWIAAMVVTAAFSKKIYKAIRKQQGAEDELH